MTDKLLFEAELVRRLRILIRIAAFASLALLQSCAGYYEYEARYENNYYNYIDNTGLFKEITGKTYSKTENFRNNVVTKTEVLEAWGKPYDIYTRSSHKDMIFYPGNEYWVYERDLSFSGIFPDIMGIPVFAVMWPSGYYESRVVFQEDKVVSINGQAGQVENGITCVLMLDCRKHWRLH